MAVDGPSGGSLSCDPSRRSITSAPPIALIDNGDRGGLLLSERLALFNPSAMSVRGLGKRCLLDSTPTLLSVER
jgi:hypothetical protein